MPRFASIICSKSFILSKPRWDNLLRPRAIRLLLKCAAFSSIQVSQTLAILNSMILASVTLPTWSRLMRPMVLLARQPFIILQMASSLDNSMLQAKVKLREKMRGQMGLYYQTMTWILSRNSSLATQKPQSRDIKLNNRPESRHKKSQSKTIL